MPYQQCLPVAHERSRIERADQLLEGVRHQRLVGKVTKVVDDDQIEVEIADGVRVRQMRSMVSEVRAKGEPVKDDGAS
jgi:hypothetical protein